MKSSGIYRIYVLALAMSVMFGASAQEYDDMYFTKKDRKKVSYDLEPSSNDSRATYESYTNNTYSEDYSSKEVNPEYIARYQSQSDFSQNNNPNQQGSVQENYNFSQQGYYPENEPEGNGQTVINNYYGPGAAQGMNFPAGNNIIAPRVNYGLGFNSWGGWNSGVSIAIGAPVGFGMMYDPFWDPIMYSRWQAGFYDPFFFASPYRNPFRWRAGWGAGWYGGGFGMGWNNWAYRQGFNDGFFNGTFYDTERRLIAYQPRRTRNGVVYGNNRTSGRSRNTEARRVDSRRNYTQTQNEYYTRSRRSVSNNSVYSRGDFGDNSRRSTYSSSGRTASSRESYNSRRDVYSNQSRSGRTESYDTQSRSSSRSGFNSRYSNSSNSSRGSYSTPSSSSRSGRYSTPSSSNSRSSGSYNRSSGSSRSNRSGSYNRSSGSSRSSGSYNRSSGSSRSSGGGGSSRSRSGGGSRRGG